MKKFTAFFIALLMLFPTFAFMTASAWEIPQLSLQASYNEKNQTVTVTYRVLDFAGTESADFRLKYNQDILEYKEAKEEEFANTIMAINDTGDGIVAIQFADMYYVKEEDCEEDGSAVIATITFRVKDTSANSAVLIATEDSCNMDPDSQSVSLDRATLKVPLKNGSISVSTDEEYTSPSDNGMSETNKGNVKKVVIALVIAAIAFIVILAAVVIKYRKSDNNTADKKEN